MKLHADWPGNEVILVLPARLHAGLSRLKSQLWIIPQPKFIVLSEAMAKALELGNKAGLWISHSLHYNIVVMDSSPGFPAAMYEATE